jgi:hypothetical protein
MCAWRRQAVRSEEKLQREGPGRPGEIILLWGIRELLGSNRRNEASRDDYPTERTEREGDVKGTTNRKVVLSPSSWPDGPDRQ